MHKIKGFPCSVFATHLVIHKLCQARHVPQEPGEGGGDVGDDVPTDSIVSDDLHHGQLRVAGAESAQYHGVPGGERLDDLGLDVHHSEHED